MKEKACKNCNFITTGNVCPACGSSALSTDWSGYVIIRNVEESLIAKKMNITRPGKYALKVR
ncbi:MAG: transcription elongation factor subunit Spt4 [Candidatus Hadarchaeales archaeon]